jgi:hypothetical protein
LAHFFGHSLRDVMMQGDRNSQAHTVHSRSIRENVVPLVLSSIGLVLTLGVLYEARVQLGQVGAERYTFDMEQVEEFRRQAGWLRVDGEILAANELTNRAEDMQAVAIDLREYSNSMSRMNVPILLLNLTLVLCAISAAYFHRRDGRREKFNETPFEDERRDLVEKGESVAEETARLLSEVQKEARLLENLALSGEVIKEGSALHQLESIFATYRAENGRARRIDPHAIAAFRKPMTLALEVHPSENGKPTIREPDEYVRERGELATRFNQLRTQFNEEATTSW